MLGSYRGIFAAIGGLALCGAAPPQKEPISPEASQQIEPPAGPASDYSPYPDKHADECYEAENHDSADLCAQWRAAIAAEESSDAAGWGNVIDASTAALTFLSIILVILALRQTERSLRAQREGNRIAQLASEHQLRAYVTVKHAKMEHLITRDPLVSLTLQNSGQTPAYGYRTAFIIKVCEPLDRPDIPPESELDGTWPEMLGPGVEDLHWLYFGDQLVRGSKGKIRAGELKVYVSGLVEYRDAFGDTWRYAFRYKPYSKYPSHGLFESDYECEAQILFRPRAVEAPSPRFRWPWRHTANDDTRHHEGG